MSETIIINMYLSQAQKNFTFQNSLIGFWLLKLEYGIWCPLHWRDVYKRSKFIKSPKNCCQIFAFFSCWEVHGFKSSGQIKQAVGPASSNITAINPAQPMFVSADVRKPKFHIFWSLWKDGFGHPTPYRYAEPSPLGGSKGSGWKAVSFARVSFKTKRDIFHPGTMLPPCGWWLPNVL